MLPVAIVPILVQSGTAVLPSLLAGVGTFVTVLFRPWEWLRLPPPKRRLALLTIAGSIALGCILIVLSGQMRVRSRSQTNWAQVALNIIHQEEIAAGASATGSLAHRLQPLWAYKEPGASFLSTPVVADGRVYGASCLVDVTGTFGSIFCLDAAAGQPIWKVDKIGDEDLKGIFSSPALTKDGKYLIIGEGLHFDAECHLICLEAANGKVRWKIDIPQNHIESSPAILGDVVVVGAGAIERADHLPVESPGYALAVRVSDGRVLWQRGVVDPESSPLITPDGNAYFGSGVNGCTIVAIGARGNILWKTPTLYPATGPLALAHDLLIAGVGRGDLVRADPSPAGAVLAINRHTGEVKWRTEFPDAVLGRVAIGGEKVFCPVRDGSVWGLDLETGNVVWKQKISEAPVLAGLTVSGESLYAVSSDGFLVILDAKTGKLLAKQALNDEADPGRQNLCLSSPLVTDTHLFVGSETGGLRCFVIGR